MKTAFIIFVDVFGFLSGGLIVVGLIGSLKEERKKSN